ncbi:MAG: 5,10-methylenetetrahydrofolate reductase, partial [Dehalococcoidia bacterium]|nr:5,10-methylenetetrahydrofolate reductase [Dehalococcoidia bacterium]
MLISEQKPFEEILTYLDGDKNIFLIGCKGCAEGWGSGGEKQVAEMWKKLQEQGKTIAGSVLVDMLCDSVLTRLKLRTYKKEITAADSILVLTDGAGVQTVAALVNKVVHPGC